MSKAALWHVMNMFHIPDDDLLEQIYDSATVQCSVADAPATRQNQGISHSLQIGKDHDDSSPDADHGYQFNNIVFIDEISIFAETPEGMQTLLDVVQELTTWCGVEINVKKRSCS